MLMQKKKKERKFVSNHWPNANQLTTYCLVMRKKVACSFLATLNMLSAARLPCIKKKRYANEGVFGCVVGNRLFLLPKHFDSHF
jgi:hypothetical protein